VSARPDRSRRDAHAARRLRPCCAGGSVPCGFGSPPDLRSAGWFQARPRLGLRWPRLPAVRARRPAEPVRERGAVARGRRAWVRGLPTRRERTGLSNLAGSRFALCELYKAWPSWPSLRWPAVVRNLSYRASPGAWPTERIDVRRGGDLLAAPCQLIHQVSTKPITRSRRWQACPVVWGALGLTMSWSVLPTGRISH